MLNIGQRVSLTDKDFNLGQEEDNTCAVKCQQIILRDYGIQIPEKEMAEFAEQQGWLGPNGTKGKNIGKLFDVCNIDFHKKTDANIYDLINELKDGHRVIVGVDSHELWAEPGSDEYEFYRNIEHPDHALIVTSIHIDTDNPEKSTVVLTDPGSGAIQEYEWERYAHAWKDSHCFMVATDEPAPYQYNPETQCMELSNFATDFSLQNFPFHNEFSDIYEIDQAGYVPFYEEGHLNYIDEISYDEFVLAFDEDSLTTLDDAFNMDSFAGMEHIDVQDYLTCTNDTFDNFGTIDDLNFPSTEENL